MGLFSKRKENSSEHRSKMETMADDERLEAGQLKIRIIIELLGHPKDLMEKTFDMVMTKLKSDGNHHLVKEDRADFKPQGKLWSSFTEAELWVKDFGALSALLLEYMPSSVEIMEPTQFALSNTELSNYLNDMQSRFHQADMSVKNLRAEVQVLKKQAGGLLTNIVILSLRQGPKTLDELSKTIGTEAEDLKQYMVEFEKMKKVKLEGEKYTLVGK